MTGIKQPTARESLNASHAFVLRTVWYEIHQFKRPSPHENCACVCVCSLKFPRFLPPKKETRALWIIKGGGRVVWYCSLTAGRFDMGSCSYPDVPEIKAPFDVPEACQMSLTGQERRQWSISPSWFAVHSPETISFCQSGKIKKRRLIASFCSACCPLCNNYWAEVQTGGWMKHQNALKIFFSKYKSLMSPWWNRQSSFWQGHIFSSDWSCASGQIINN